MNKLNLDKINKVYLAGIGGIGLSAIAYYFKDLDKEVIGSDQIASEVTKRLEAADIEINFKQIAKNITDDIDLFIYSSALPDDHEELLQAKEFNIPTLSYFEFLGLLSKNYKTIAVTGTNGKTSTTAMLGLMLEKAGLDPTVIVGSLVPQWESNFRFGKSDILVVEACEWKANMLKINPNIIVLTNIAEDHLDFYKNLTDIKKHFKKFVKKLPEDGLLVKNFDDKNSDEIKYNNTITFGSKEEADCYFKDIKIEESKQIFNTNKFDKVELAVPAKYNIYNALAAMCVANHLGVNKHQMWNALAEFKGVWRRFEIVGQMKSNIVISDYAHHPDSINMLLRATKDFYPDKKIIAVFQPHHHNRTKTLLDEFAKAFYLADQAIISEIYNVAGREDPSFAKASEGWDISSIDLVEKMNHKHKYYANDFKRVKEILKDINPINSVIIFIGAGDIDNLAREVID